MYKISPPIQGNVFDFCRDIPEEVKRLLPLQFCPEKFVRYLSVKVTKTTDKIEKDTKVIERKTLKYKGLQKLHKDFRHAHNPEVAGSSPAPATSFKALKFERFKAFFMWWEWSIFSPVF